MGSLNDKFMYDWMHIYEVKVLFSQNKIVTLQPISRALRARLLQNDE